MGVVSGLAVRWPVSGQVLIGAAAALATSLRLLVFYVGCFLHAPFVQRDQARSRLIDIKNARDSYEIVPVSVSRASQEEAWLTVVRIEISNQGRVEARSSQRYSTLWTDTPKGCCPPLSRHDP